MERQVKSKQRVADHGEVLTAKREDIAFIESMVRPMPAEGDKAVKEDSDE